MLFSGNRLVKKLRFSAADVNAEQPRGVRKARYDGLQTYSVWATRTAWPAKRKSLINHSLVLVWACMHCRLGRLLSMRYHKKPIFIVEIIYSLQERHAEEDT